MAKRQYNKPNPKKIEEVFLAKMKKVVEEQKKRKK